MPAHPGLHVHLSRAAEVALGGRTVRVLGPDAEPLESAPVPDHAHAAAGEHLVAPLAREQPLRVVCVLHLHESLHPRGPVLGSGALKCGVLVLAPVRQAAIVAQRHLLHLFKNVLVQPRRSGVVAPVVGEVEVDAVLGLGEVRRGRPDVRHDGMRMPLYTSNAEVRRFRQRHADAGLEIEGAVRDARVPRAGGEQRVLWPAVR
jgi:hypothetical protein